MRRLPLVLAFVLAAGVCSGAPRAGDVPARESPARESRGSEVQVHEVQEGESLWTIAAAAIGDGSLWPALYRANRDQIKDPSLLYPGQKLTIPAVDPAARAALRREARALITP